MQDINVDEPSETIPRVPQSMQPTAPLVKSGPTIAESTQIAMSRTFFLAFPGHDRPPDCTIACMNDIKGGERSQPKFSEMYRIGGSGHPDGRRAGGRAGNSPRRPSRRFAARSGTRITVRRMAPGTTEPGKGGQGQVVDVDRFAGGQAGETQLDLVGHGLVRPDSRRGDRRGRGRRASRRPGPPCSRRARDRSRSRRSRSRSPRRWRPR